MDRSEAYRLLMIEMQKLADLSVDQLAARCENGVEIDCRGTDGTLFIVSLSVVQQAAHRFVVKGSIHDNNSYRFSKLEEDLEIDFSSKG
jgi:hypothetical protein